VNTMNLDDKLEQATSFFYFSSEDIQKGPDVAGLSFDDPNTGREAFIEILESTERGFIRISLYLLGNTLRIIINDLKNCHIVTANNLRVDSEDLANLKSAYVSHREFSFAFGIFPNVRRLELFPITKKEVVLTVKSWEILEF